MVSFTLGATYETIASPANLKRWGLAESSSFELCHREGCDVKHVLSGCEVALSQGRYKYRHDAVLRRLMHGLSQDINKANNSKEGKKIVGMEFVHEGQAVVKKPKAYRSILQEAKDWSADVDLDKQLEFPQENFEPRHIDKLERDEELAAGCREAGWKVYLFAVEVGAREYAAESLQCCLRRLGLQWRRIKKISKEASVL